MQIDSQQQDTIELQNASMHNSAAQIACGSSMRDTPVLCGRVNVSNLTLTGGHDMCAYVTLLPARLPFQALHRLI